MTLLWCLCIYFLVFLLDYEKVILYTAGNTCLHKLQRHEKPVLLSFPQVLLLFTLCKYIDYISQCMLVEGHVSESLVKELWVILEYTNFRPNTLFPLPSSVKGFKTQKPLPSVHGAEHLRQESTITSINWLECSWETLLLPKPLKLWQFPQHILFIWVTRFLSVSELKCYYTLFFMF